MFGDDANPDAVEEGLAGFLRDLDVEEQNMRDVGVMPEQTRIKSGLIAV